ncbi:hypothetical protein MTO96_000999 [Rhipicephalus appendiculatus]
MIWAMALSFVFGLARALTGNYKYEDCDQDSEWLQLEPTMRIFGVTLPVPGMERDMCKEVYHCPMVKGRQYNGTMTVHVPFYAPPFEVKVQLKMIGSTAEIRLAQIEPCDSDPCVLKRGSTTKLHFVIIADHDSETAVLDARFKLFGFMMAIPGLEKDLCKNFVQCPIVKGEGVRRHSGGVHTLHRALRE